MTGDSGEPQIVWGPCCFCVEAIPESEVDPCRRTVETSKGAWQVWFCHAECFKSRLGTNFDDPELLAPGIF